MSNQPTQVLYGAGEPMEIESATYTCPYCQADILQSNKDTHEARCARMNRDQPQRPAQQPTKEQNVQQVGRQDERDAGGLRITREHSSSSIPYPNEPTTTRQPQVRREARRIAENKLITCANCEKSVREDNLTNHLNHECQGSDKIPCEFCDKQVSMTEYQNHVDNCPKRHEEVQHERARSLERMRQDELRMRQDEENLRQIQADQRRVHSAERRTQNTQPQRQEQQQEQAQPQEGHGFMNFLKNLATAALQNRSDVEDSQTQAQNQPQNQQQRQQRQQEQEQQRQQQQRQQQQQQRQEAQQPSFLARLLGLVPETPEEAEIRQQRALQAQQRQEQRIRAEQQRRQQEQQRRQQEAEMLSNLFEPNPMMGRRASPGRNQGNVVRTIRFGPHGSFVITSRGAGPEQRPMQGYRPTQMSTMEHEMEEMGPLGMLLSMMNGGIPGMVVVSPEELQDMTQEQQAGLAREVMDSLSVIKYDKEKNKNVSEDLKSCPICIEEFENGDEVRYLWCMHRFHKGCVDKWLEGHSNCPICKKEYSESEVSYE